MGLFRRRPKLPAADRPPLEREERVLAWARTGAATGGANDVTGGASGTTGGAGDAIGGGGGVLVVTNRGLWLPGQAQRLGWHRVHKAVWSGTELAVTPAEVVAERDGYAVLADLPVLTYPLPEPGDVPHHVRTRVTGSVGYTAHHRLSGGGGVRVVARRVSGIDGLSWTVRYDPGTPADDPQVTAETDRLVTAARVASTPQD